MPDGGTLTVSASAEDGSVAIRVRDTGGGIPDELNDKLFKPLFTGKANGTGLGLAVVKRIVDAHGGTISFESVKEGGRRSPLPYRLKVNERRYVRVYTTEDDSREGSDDIRKRVRCLCCTTCPTFKLTRCSWWVHCATGKSKKHPEMLGCDRRKCPIYVQDAPTRGYYCIHGAAES